MTGRTAIDVKGGVGFKLGKERKKESDPAELVVRWFLFVFCFLLLRRVEYMHTYNKTILLIYSDDDDDDGTKIRPFGGS